MCASLNDKKGFNSKDAIIFIHQEYGVFVSTEQAQHFQWIRATVREEELMGHRLVRLTSVSWVYNTLKTVKFCEVATDFVDSIQVGFEMDFPDFSTVFVRIPYFASVATDFVKTTTDFVVYHLASDSNGFLAFLGILYFSRISLAFYACNWQLSFNNFPVSGS